MNFIKRFLRAWKDASLQQQYLSSGDEWNKEDAIWLAQVLSSPTGQKFMQRLTNTVIRSTFDATRRTLNPRFHCGVARGMTLLKTAIDSDYQAGISLAGAQSGNSEAAEAEREDADLDSLLAQI